MTKVLHIIGQQGVGKSTLARAIQKDWQAAGRTCENLTELGEHEPSQWTDIQPFRDFGIRKPYAKETMRLDVLIVEHLEQPHPKQVQSGDLLIRMELAT